MSLDVENVHERKETHAVSWAIGAPHFQNVSVSDGVCVRVLEEGRQGLVTSRQIEPSHHAQLVEEARKMARFSPVDPHRAFGKKAPSYPAVIPMDASLFSKPLGEMEVRLAALEKKILSIDRRIKKVIRLNYTESKSTRTLTNSHSLNLADESTHVSFVVEVLAEEAKQTEVAWDFQSRRFAKDIPLELMAVDVAQSAVRSLGGKPLPSGPWAVVVDPRVGAQLLQLVSEALSAKAVQRGRSFFHSQMDKRVAASCVTLVDDPLLPSGVASASFDDEGTPQETLTVVEEGILKDYFYDLHAASIAGRASNGRGLKATLGAIPRPAPTNFYMKPGAISQEEMLSSHPKVFLLRDVMGLHMADPITGEFSLGASGALYENGKFSRPVRGVTIAGSLGSVLKDVTAVGTDLTWYGGTGAPSFLLPQISIAGS